MIAPVFFRGAKAGLSKFISGKVLEKFGLQAKSTDSMNKTLYNPRKDRRRLWKISCTNDVVCLKHGQVEITPVGICWNASRKTDGLWSEADIDPRWMIKKIKRWSSQCLLFAQWLQRKSCGRWLPLEDCADGWPSSSHTCPAPPRLQTPCWEERMLRTNGSWSDRRHHHCCWSSGSGLAWKNVVTSPTLLFPSCDFTAGPNLSRLMTSHPAASAAQVTLGRPGVKWNEGNLSYFCNRKHFNLI